MKTALRVFAMALLITMVAVGTVRAQELARIRESQRWRIASPCFDWRGKWYTRGG